MTEDCVETPPLLVSPRKSAEIEVNSSAKSPRSSNLDPLSLSIDRDFDSLSLGNEFSTPKDELGQDEGLLTFSQKFKAYTKLEVLNAHGINALVFGFNICAAISILFSVISIVLAHTVFKESTPPLLFKKSIEFTIWNPMVKDGVWFGRLESSIMIILFVYSVLLFLTYVCLLFTSKEKHVSNEQVWTALLLFAIVVYMNPFDAISRLINSNTPIAPVASQAVRAFFMSLRYASFSFANLLYIWLNAESYRKLHGYITWKQWRFYTPKVTLVSMYVIYKLLFSFLFDIYFSEVPFMSAIGAIRLYFITKVSPALGVASVVVLTLFEVVLVTLIVRNLIETVRDHNNADYMRHRTKIVGFRFFLHQHIIFYSAFTLIYIVVLLGFPGGNQALLFWLGYNRSKRALPTAVFLSTAQGSYFDIQYAPVGLQVALLAYTTIEAYTCLPATVRIFKENSNGQKRLGAYAANAKTLAYRRAGISMSNAMDSTPKQEPISYRRHEVGGGESVAARPNCFTMATHIKLFNLAWYIYYHGTAKEEKVASDVAHTDLRVYCVVHSDATDTRALILESDDRICVAFKGTSSATNVSTDVRLAQMALRRVLPTDVPLDTTPMSAPNTSFSEQSAEHEIDQLVTSGVFRRSRVHIGFARAYRSVAPSLLRAVRELLRARSRPVLFCGHSLGGALATLASADLVLQPWWGQLRRTQSVLVSTFGAPKVGNRAFCKTYEDLCIAHWRVVAGGDVVARLPSPGYAHVGRRVALSTRGDLFVDPDALEARLWHRPAASAVHHRKATYLLALRGWCERNHGRANKHGFWSFPISKADSRRFQDAFSKNSAPVSSYTTVPMDSSQRNRVTAARLRVWADAVDMLEPKNVTNEFVPLSPLQRWARLTKPVLADLRAHDKMMEEVEAPISIALMET